MTTRTRIVLALGAAQTLAWASSYYLPAILADPIAADLGLSRDAFFAIFSAALLLSAAIGPAVGRSIDRHGGRPVLIASNLVIAGGLVILALAHGVVALVIAWALLGVGMATGLYDSAFAALARLYGTGARGAITGVTLMAGFASTIGWPVTAFLAGTIGWRDACLVWALLHIVMGLPLHFALPGPRAPAPLPASASEPDADEAPRHAMALLAFVFAATWFVTGAMAVHLPHLLEIAGASPAAAIAAAALVGPAQVGARLAEFALMRWCPALVSARVATVLHPLGAGALTLFGASGAAAFALLHGAGNGMLTVAKGTLPLAIFGPAGYGLRSGIIAAPARAAQAAAPLLFGLLIERLGANALVASAGLSLAALVALLLLRPRAAPAPPLTAPAQAPPLPRRAAAGR